MLSRALSAGRGGLAPGAAARYEVPASAIASFRERGWAVLPRFLSEAEIAPIEASYARFMRGEVAMPEKDFMDMSQPFAAIKGKHPDDWQIVNAMLPRKYLPSLAGNVYELRAAAAAAQLFPDTKMALDYDQLLNKRPGKAGAVFAWHQDMACAWPRGARERARGRGRGRRRRRRRAAVAGAGTCGARSGTSARPDGRLGCSCDRNNRPLAIDLCERPPGDSASIAERRALTLPPTAPLRGAAAAPQTGPRRPTRAP